MVQMMLNKRILSSALISGLMEAGGVNLGIVDGGC